MEAGDAVRGKSKNLLAKNLVNEPGFSLFPKKTIYMTFSVLIITNSWGNDNIGCTKGWSM